MLYRVAGFFALYGAVWIFAGILNHPEWFREWPLDLGFPAAFIALVACVGAGILSATVIFAGKAALK